ncbi:MAG: response regulator [Acidobacteria bacterium]|jgi:PleD family two-component response regulator|nr:response regulator [Acidobacteriota bacterium]
MKGRGPHRNRHRDEGIHTPPRRAVAAVDDLFFASKINEAAKRAGILVDFVKDDRSLLELAAAKPALIILDLNFSAIKPLQTITKLKAKPEFRGISVVGYVSHEQGELKQRAHDLGCDMVMARSAFSQNLPTLLKRHAVR